MARGLREIKEKAKVADIFVVVLDARCPISSYNVEFDKIFINVPRLFVFSKFDLADQKKIKIFTKKFVSFSGKEVLFLNLKQEKSRNLILRKVEKIILEKKLSDNKKQNFYKRKNNVFVVGVPNSGKSSLINLLVKKNKVKVANLPGTTRAQQWISFTKWQFLDTPGILWPKSEDEESFLKLAIIGSINVNIFDRRLLANFAYKTLSFYYPDKIKKINLEPCSDEIEIYNQFERLAIINNWKIKGKGFDIEKSMIFFINFIKNMKGVTFD